MTDFVSVDECAELRGLAADGVDQQTIAARMDRSPSTVRFHVKGLCQHGGCEVPDRPISDEELIAAMHDCAAHYGRIPTGKEWDAWDDRPRSSKTVIRRLGVETWREALKVAEFRVPAKGSTIPIRATAYQKPSLCSNPAEVDG